MTSLAVLQPLKRTLTDIMDEDIYHVPASPTHQFATQNMTFNNTTNIATNVNSNYNATSNSGSQAVQDTNTYNMMMNADPAVLLGASLGIPPSSSNSLTAFYNHYNTSNGTLSDMTAPTSAPSISYKHSVQNSPELSASQHSANYSIPGMFLEDDLFGSAAYDNVAAAAANTNGLGMDVQDNSQSINPFNAHSNPELQVSDRYRFNANTTSMPTSMPPRPKGNRITTLGLDQQSKKDEYMEFLQLIDPDVSPSSFIQQQPSTISLYEELQDNVDQFDDYHHLEEIEEEQLSDDDEEDDDDAGYFQEMDDAFDDYMMNSQTQFVSQDLGMTSNEDISATEQQLVLESQIKPDMLNAVESFDLDTISQESLMNTIQNVPDLVSDDDEMMFEEDEQVAAPIPAAPVGLVSEDLDFPEEHGAAIKRRAKAAHHSTAAEISANNPDHLCDLINPSTGLPCNRQFSRPYDLIRHQDTIHAAKKKIFRCVICEGRRFGGPGNGNSKTFSRNDALSRHIKMKHGIVGDEALDLINDAKANVEYVQGQ